ncbi:MAG: type II toxin-antitoxin system RelE/ParE family toxin [Desulfobulbaceae bacterium]|nr:type II toxin-antitoxin system RelE/ParE family toxin [Desulfobulbaceae bacterium]
MDKIEWSLPAISDLKTAGEYIAEENLTAAKRMASRVQEGVEYLAEHPHMGRPGRLEGTRELVVSGTPFIVVYWVREGAVQILRVLHHARKWP